MTTSETIKNLCGSVNPRPKERGETMEEYEYCKAEKLEKDCRLARERGKTVCVWDSPRGINPTPGCTGKILHVDHFVFCPFCGKPIKVKP
jgi:hypothetical protein